MKVMIPKRYTYTEKDVDENYMYNREVLKLPDKYELMQNGTNPHPLVPSWSKDTDYSAENLVYTIIEHGGKTYRLLYKALTTSTDKFPPKSPLEWVIVKANDEYTIFDDYLNTQGIIDYRGVKLTYNDNVDVALLNVANCLSFDIKFINLETNIDIEAKIYSKYAKDFYEYFYDDFIPKVDWFFEKPFINIDKVELTFGGSTEVGTCIVGQSHYIGDALYGYEKRSRDFSKKVTNSSGYDFLQEGNKTKKYVVKLKIHNDLAPQVFSLLQGLSSTLCLYILEDGESVFGWYKDLYMTKSNPVFSDYNLEINGVI